MRLRAILATSLSLLASSLAAQANWADYRPATLASALQHGAHDADTLAPPAGSWQVALEPRHAMRAIVVSTGRHRPLSNDARRMLVEWGAGVMHDSSVVNRFTNEYQFTEDGRPFWIPLQTALEESFAREVQAGGRVTLLVLWLGTVRLVPAQPRFVFIVNEFEEAPPKAPPSQWELNGFLIGQHVSSIDSALGAPWRVIKGEHGGSDRVYVIDRARGAYMAFHFDSAPAGIATAVQIAGPKGTAMRPLLGIALGTSKDSLAARLGPSTWVTHEDDVNVDLYDWVDRNYSFEVDTAGRVNSIRIGGGVGLRAQPGDSEPDVLDRLGEALDAGTADALIDVIAPDVEITTGDKVVAFRRAPRSELEDRTSPVRTGLAKVKEGMRQPPDRAPLRVTELMGMMLVRQWDAGPVQELVFRWFPGGFRLWEAKLR